MFAFPRIRQSEPNTAEPDYNDTARFGLPMFFLIFVGADYDLSRVVQYLAVLRLWFTVVTLKPHKLLVKKSTN